MALSHSNIQFTLKVTIETCYYLKIHVSNEIDIRQPMGKHSYRTCIPRLVGGNAVRSYQIVIDIITRPGYRETCIYMATHWLLHHSNTEKSVLLYIL